MSFAKGFFGGFPGGAIGAAASCAVAKKAQAGGGAADAGAPLDAARLANSLITGGIAMSVWKVLKTVFTAGATAFTIAGVVYVINEVRKEYDSTVDENNRLRDFINEHDFYKKAKPAKKRASALCEAETVKRDDGSTAKVYYDAASDFSLYAPQG